MKYWTERAARHYAGMLEQIERQDIVRLDFARFLAALETSVEEARREDNTHKLAAALRVADERTEVSTALRFACAIRSMQDRKYECACVAWDDGGRCWSDSPEEPGVPSSETAAKCMRDACEEIVRLRGEIASRDLADGLGGI